MGFFQPSSCIFCAGCFSGMDPWPFLNSAFPNPTGLLSPAFLFRQQAPGPQQSPNDSATAAAATAALQWGWLGLGPNAGAIRNGLLAPAFTAMPRLPNAASMIPNPQTLAGQRNYQRALFQPNAAVDLSMPTSAERSSRTRGHGDMGGGGLLQPLLGEGVGIAPVHRAPKRRANSSCHTTTFSVDNLLKSLHLEKTTKEKTVVDDGECL